MTQSSTMHHLGTAMYPAKCSESPFQLSTDGGKNFTRVQPTIEGDVVRLSLDDDASGSRAAYVGISVLSHKRNLWTRVS